MIVTFVEFKLIGVGLTWGILCTSNKLLQHTAKEPSL